MVKTTTWNRLERSRSVQIICFFSGSLESKRPSLLTKRFTEAPTPGTSTFHGLGLLEKNAFKMVVVTQESEGQSDHINHRLPIS